MSRQVIQPWEEGREEILGRPRPTKAKPRKAGGSPPFSLWRHWCWHMAKNYGAAMGEAPTGGDLGHMKNVLNLINRDFDVAKKMVDLLFMDWKFFSAKFPVAKDKPTPTPWLLDALKHEVYGFVLKGGASGPGAHRFSRCGSDGFEEQGRKLMGAEGKK